MTVDDLRVKLKSGEGTYLVFETTHLTMKAEALLNSEGIPNRLFPKPRKVVSECGLVVKVMEADLERVQALCSDKGVNIKEVLNID